MNKRTKQRRKALGYDIKEDDESLEQVTSDTNIPS